MGKNKNRTDLLAAGREKLQQFRQKKDGKSSSSHGKSSKKSSKSGQHDSEVNEVSVSTTPTAISQIPEVETAVPLDGNTIDSLEPHNKESVHASLSPAMVDSLDASTVAAEMETSSKENEELLPSQEDNPDVSLVYARGDQEMDVGAMQEADGLGSKQHDGSHAIELEEYDRVAVSEPGESADTAERQALECMGTEIVASQVKQDDGAGGEFASSGVMDTGGFTESGLSSHEAGETLGVVDGVANQAGEISCATSVDEEKFEMLTVAAEMESASKENEESLPLQDDIPDVSLVRARGDQVMDVGAMQEADGLGLKQHNGSNAIDLEEDGRDAISQPGESAKSAESQALERMGIEITASQVLQNDGAGDELASTGFMGIEGLTQSGLSPREASGTLGVVDEVANQAGEVTSATSADEDKFEMLPGTGQHENSEEFSQADDFSGTHQQRYMPEESFVIVGGSHEDHHPSTKSAKLYDTCTSSLGDASPFCFSQLIEAVKGLSEDDYKLLLMSRESTRSFITSQHDFPDLIERLSKELFVASCEKDILLLQLSEQSKTSVSVLEKSLSDSLSGGKPSVLEVPTAPVAFTILKRHLEEAELALGKLDKAMESIDLSKSGVKVVAPSVSRLIDAFESKTQFDDHEVERKSVTENRSPAADPFALMREHMGDLKEVLNKIASDVVNASSSHEEEQEIRRDGNVTTELKLQFEALEQHTVLLEAVNIELGVLYEATKLHALDVNEKNKEVEDLYETLKQEASDLKASNAELSVNLSMYESKVLELQNQLDDLQRSSNDLVSQLSSQLDAFQTEASDRALKVEQDWASTISRMTEAVQRLDNTIGVSATSIIAVSADGFGSFSGHATSSIDAAIKMIGDLKEKLEAVSSEHESTFNLHEELNDKHNDLLRKVESTNDILHMLYSDLWKTVQGSHVSSGEIEVGTQDVEWSDPVDYSRYRSLVDQIEILLAERLWLQSINHELNLEMNSRTKDFEELKRKLADSSDVEKLIGLVEGIVKLDGPDSGDISILKLEVLVSSLVHKYQMAEMELVRSKEEFRSKVEELIDLQEEMHELSALKIQYETEILLLKERLSQVEQALLSMQDELQEKVTEVEQSEQRVSSIREKLSIAVAKGKGLVVQRDGLKQSLLETSSELERCSHELQLKDARLHELETKLKTYSEAGERVEALESELSYIRNSATALRESFLLKDSVLQRIEEVLEDLDLPEHFHSRGIIEKVEWLARSATGNSLPPADWDQKNSVGGSYSDTGFAVMDSWKEDAQPGSNSDDLRRKYEDLQGKFYGLAEQNEMLEQSLVERNQLVQRWEEVLDRINMPAHLRSVEPEDRIEWIGNALSEANHDRESLLQNIDKLENYCGLLTADLEQYQSRTSSLNSELEESQRRISDLEMAVRGVRQERDDLSERLKVLSHDHENLSLKVAQLERDNSNLHNEITGLEEKLGQNEEHVQRINGEICRLQDLVCGALEDPGCKNLISGGDSIECLERLLKKLIEDYATHSQMNDVLQDADEELHVKQAVENNDEGKTRDIMDGAESNFSVLMREMEHSDDKSLDSLKTQLEETLSEMNYVKEERDKFMEKQQNLKTQLEETLSELNYVKEERDKFMEKQQNLVTEIEALERKTAEYHELYKQEEQKSASLREKLNVAVRKGKSLVQHRDNLKQSIEEMTAELEHLKSDLKHRESTVADYELKMRDLITYSERVEVLESESLILKNHLAEKDQALHDKEQSLSIMLNALGEIDIGGQIYLSDPIKKLEHIGKAFHEFHATLASCEEESRKSRKAAELLLAELNEVQDRNDSLQEELAKATDELAQLHKNRDVIENDKFVALSRLEKLSLFHSEEQKKRNSELLSLKSASDQLLKNYSFMNNLLATVFSKDLEFMRDLESRMNLCFERQEADHLANVPLSSASDSIIYWDLGNKESFLAEEFPSEISMPGHFEDDFTIEVFGSLQDLKKQMAASKVTLHEYLVMYQKQARNLLNLMGVIHGDMASQKESLEVLKRDARHKDTVEQEKEMEIISLRRGIDLLYEACSSSLLEIENSKAAGVESWAVEDQGLNLKPTTTYVGQNNFTSDKDAKDMAEKLLSSVKSFCAIKGEMFEGDKKEMKATILNLQKELQEKEIQRERICRDLVSQIKQAEAAAASYSQDLQSAKSTVLELEKRVAMVEEERNLLEQRVKELQDQQTVCADLHVKIRSLNDMLSAKDQEIEALTQALDEEEVQMEDLSNKIQELEKVVQQKNLDIENLETSRGKAMKKLSITVNKFDELHHFSESLLAEVEKLQSQLQERDGEISFLRQEVTRCTNDALIASQMSNKRNSDEIYELFVWLGTLVSLEVNLEESSGVQEWKDIVQRKISSVFSELEGLRLSAQNTETLLQTERSKVDELTQRVESLDKSLHEREAQLNMLGLDGDSSLQTNANSEIVEVEPLINKWTVPGASTTSQVRSLRKANNDQVAIAIDMDPAGTSKLQDEDDEKAHGFKSLTSSRIVPKFTRPVTDMVDGLWVSCDRALMRQPGLRLGIMIYWAVLHTLLAAFVV